MFRVTEDTSLRELKAGDIENIYFVHKKLLWFWIKWSTKKWKVMNGLYTIKNNIVVGNESDVLWHLKNGEYKFSPGETPQFFISRDAGKQEVTYYDSVEDFLAKNAEDLI